MKGRALRLEQRSDEEGVAVQLHGADLAAGIVRAGAQRPREQGSVEGEGKRKVFRPAYRLHDLRHTAATLLLRAGVNPKVTSERLGHSSVAFTRDVYSASLPDMQEEAAGKLESMLAGGWRVSGTVPRKAILHFVICKARLNHA